MSYFFRFKQALKRGAQASKQYWSRGPTSKLLMINGGVYCMWKLKIIPQDFLVKHFSLERFNISNNRFHTLLTYSFSHIGIFSLLFDALMIGFMGNAIQKNIGKKYVWWLYLSGAIFGGITHIAFQRPQPYIAPQVGPQSSVAAFLTFMACLNPHAQFYLFFVPVKAWVLIALMGFYSLATDPHKKYFAGITAGLTVYQAMRIGIL